MDLRGRKGRWARKTRHSLDGGVFQVMSRVTSFLSIQKMTARKLLSALRRSGVSWEWKEGRHRLIAGHGTTGTKSGSGWERSRQYLWALSLVTIAVLILMR